MAFYVENGHFGAEKQGGGALMSQVNRIVFSPKKLNIRVKKLCQVGKDLHGHIQVHTIF